MADKSGIEWTDATWNPATGCTEVSPGCDHCYAKTFAERWRGTPGHHFEQGFDVVLRPERLDQPMRWRKPRRIFVNSMSDLFHDAIPDEYIARVFAVMANAPRHTFQILTKRHGRMRSLLNSDRFRELFDVEWCGIVDWCRAPLPDPDFVNIPHLNDGPLPNVWLGVSVENQQWADIRVPALLKTPAAVRFLSMEPLLGPVSFRWAKWVEWINGNHLDGLRGIDWVIVGGESGHGARPMQMPWVRTLRDQCVDASVPFLFKQWGAFGPANATDDPDLLINLGKKAAGRELDGRTWDEFPEAVARA
jgi:protein gp37